mgnify:CR=1 FL=1
MKILLVGSGGREHAIAWKLAQNKNVSKIFVAPGNGGTALENKCENINITDLNELVEFAKENNIDFTFVGPEEPLTNGITDKFKKVGLKCFGPDARAAQLEGSKTFAKEFMKKYGVKTAQYEIFTDYNLAKEYLQKCDYPIVIKADGLASGKGVVIARTREQAMNTIDDFMILDVFKGAGKSIVIEEFLEGIEASILSITDGKTLIPFISGKDHKQIFDGDKGPNTGGMGVIAPNPFVTEDVMKDFEENIMTKTLNGIKEEGFDFKGIIFFGLMITKKGTYLLEYNVRMGDPETQSVLSLMESDLVEIIEAALEQRLNEVEVKWMDGACVNVVLASGGYPGSFEKGFEITIDESIKDKVFLAGAQLQDEILRTSGGRVLSVVGLGTTVEEARKDAYEKVELVNFQGKYYRKDIGIAK